MKKKRVLPLSERENSKADIHVIIEREVSE